LPTGSAKCRNATHTHTHTHTESSKQLLFFIFFVGEKGWGTAKPGHMRSARYTSVRILSSSCRNLWAHLLSQLKLQEARVFVFTTCNKRSYNCVTRNSLLSDLRVASERQRFYTLHLDIDVKWTASIYRF